MIKASSIVGLPVMNGSRGRLFCAARVVATAVMAVREVMAGTVAG
jgi:hypothetical protein